MVVVTHNEDAQLSESNWLSNSPKCLYQVELKVIQKD
jgi:hypothetical protein